MISAIYSSSVPRCINHVYVTEWQSSQNQVRQLHGSSSFLSSLPSVSLLPSGIQLLIPPLLFDSYPVRLVLFLPSFFFFYPERHRHLDLTAIISSLPSRVRTGVCGPAQHLLAPCRPSAHYPPHRSLLHWWTIAATNSEQREGKRNG